MPASPPLSLDSGYAQLDRIYQTKSSLEQLARLREEMQSELARSQGESEQLSRYRQLLNELTREKDAHIEELRDINTDINALQSTIKQAEAEQQRAFDAAQKLYRHAERAREQTNALCAAAAVDRHMPPSDADAAQLLAQQPPMAMAAAAAAAAGAGGAPLFLQQMGLGGLPAGFPFAFANSALMDSPRALQQAHLGGDSGDASPVKKQTPAPMKTCESCQQEIHRNAPICPNCKCKSTSKNPKKPKRKEIKKL